MKFLHHFSFKNYLQISVDIMAETQRLVMVDTGSGSTCRTFVFKNEGHTLGNALRAVILQNPEVIFCGYTLPHPAEDQMHLRIQTIAGVDAQDALLKGLQDLKAVTAHTKKVFSQSVADSKLN